MDAQAQDILTVTPTTAGGESNSGRIVGIKFRQNNNAAQTDGKAGLVLNGMRHFRVEDCDFDALDIGMDMRGNCFGTTLSKLTSVGSRVQVGIMLRGATPLTGGSVAGSGSDITMMDCWMGGRRASVWMEPNAGGYHFFTGQLKGGIEVGVQQDDYGSVTMGRGYDALATTTADVNPGATTIPVSAASSTNFFTSSSLVIGANHRVTYTGRDTPNLQLTGVGGITTFIPSGTPIYLRGAVSVVDFYGTSWEGSSHRHAIRAYNQLDGLTLDGCSINSNGSNRIMQIIKGTDCQLSVISFRRLGVRGTFTGTVPLDLQNLAGSWDIQEDQPNVYQSASFNGVTMNFQTKPMTEWSGVNTRVRASFGDNTRWQGRTFRWNGSTLESHTQSDATTGWVAVGGGTEAGTPHPGNIALGSSDTADRLGSWPEFTRLSTVAPLTDAATVAGDLYIPQIFKVPEGVTDPYASEPYRIYHSTDHDPGAGGIYLLTAATINGPFTDRGLIYQDLVSGNQTEGPWVVYNELDGLFYLYYQQNGVGGEQVDLPGHQRRRGGHLVPCRRGDGARRLQLGGRGRYVAAQRLRADHARPASSGGRWTLWFGTDYGEYALWLSRDGRTWYRDGRRLHHGQYFHGDNEKRFGWNGAQGIYWKGRRLVFGSFSAFVSGSESSPLGLVCGPLAGGSAQDRWCPGDRVQRYRRRSLGGRDSDEHARVAVQRERQALRAVQVRHRRRAGGGRMSALMFDYSGARVPLGPRTYELEATPIFGETLPTWLDTPNGTTHPARPGHHPGDHPHHDGRNVG